jgi:hypothetical protein
MSFNSIHDRVVHVLKEFLLEAGATKGRDLRLEVPRIRSGASRYRHGDMVWLDFMPPQRHLVRLGIHGIVDILQAYFVAISDTFRIRGLRKHHEIRRYCPDDIIDP